jgi:hypothetical protein
MSRGTLKRSIRIDDKLWADAKTTARMRGEVLAEVIRAALVEYVKTSEDQASTGTASTR